MNTYRIRYTTMRRRLDNVKDVQAETLRDAIALFNRINRTGTIDSVHCDGVLVWHRRLGDVCAHPTDEMLARRNETHLPRWDLQQLRAFLDERPCHGVFANGGTVYATDDDSSGQSQNRKAVLRYRDVFMLVNEGRLAMVPVLYQSYWMYRQVRPGTHAASPVLFPTAIPVREDFRF